MGFWGIRVCFFRGDSDDDTCARMLLASTQFEKNDIPTAKFKIN
jgi:hypothetical protein